MANLILRFGLCTQKENIDIQHFFQKLSKKNVENVYSKGEKHGRHIRKESAIGYDYKFENITEVNEVCNFFIEEWKEYENVLQELQSSGFELFLLFEFDLENSDFPELVFDNGFIKFLSSINTELQMYFYT